MRKYLVLALLPIALFVAGCATTEKSSGSGERDSPPPAVKPYE
jgi:predicted small secreted protein